MQHDIFLSICILAYNHEIFLHRAVESVLSQIVDFSIEIIIAEDYSSDSTLSIAIDYQNRFPDKIKVFHSGKKNKLFINGQQTGRYNFLSVLQKCRGKYIALLDGDDFWIDIKKLQIQTDHLERHPNCSLTFHNVYLEMNDNPSELSHTYLADNFFNKKNLKNLLLQLNYIPTSSVVFRNNIPNKFPEIFYKYPFADWPLHLYNLNFGNPEYIDKVMGVYRFGSGTWTKRNAVTQVNSILEFYDDVQEILPKAMLRHKPLALSKNHFRIAFLYLRKINFSRFAVHFLYGLWQFMVWISLKIKINWNS